MVIKTYTNICSFFVIPVLCIGSLLSQPLPTVSDTLKFPYRKKGKENTSLWPFIKPDRNHEIYLLEDFEMNLPWLIKPARAERYIHRFVFMNPMTANKKPLRVQAQAGIGDMQEAYQSDLRKLEASSGIHDRSKVSEQNYSYELRCIFESPGDDFVVLYPNPNSTRNFRLKGIPRLFALWVKGNKKKHKLYALFSDHKNIDIPVYMGDLNFSGWQRLEQLIPSHLVKRNFHRDKQYEITFKGLKIQSHNAEPPGLFITVIDLLMLFSDHAPNQYPGHQMRYFE